MGQRVPVGSRSRRRIGGGTGGLRPTSSSADRGPGRRIAARDRADHRGCCRRPSSSESARRADRTNWVRAGWPGCWGGRARRSTRCSLAMGSRAAARAPRQTFKRYEWSEPGALLHMDVKRLARFERPGPLGDRTRRAAQDPRRRLGLSARRHRRPQPLPLRRTTRTRGRRDQRPHARARAGALQRARPARAASGDDRQRDGLRARTASKASSPPPARATSPRRPTRRAGTARPRA